MEIEWNHPHRVIAHVDGKTLRVGGEGLFDRNPDFLIYPSSITHWEDGSAITAGEKRKVLEDLVAEAARRGWKFEIGALCVMISRDLYRGSGEVYRGLRCSVPCGRDIRLSRLAGRSCRHPQAHYVHCAKPKAQGLPRRRSRSCR